MGHDYLAQFGTYEHMWGIGRHVLGSQVYDYWADPWGRVHEHWADSDRLNLANGSNLVPAEEALTSQWGGGAAHEIHRSRQPLMLPAKGAGKTALARQAAHRRQFDRRYVKAARPCNTTTTPPEARSWRRPRAAWRWPRALPRGRSNRAPRVRSFGST